GERNGRSAFAAASAGRHSAQRGVMTRMMRASVLVGCLLGVLSVSAAAQLRRPKADVRTLVEGTARAGDRARVALEVVLPQGLHTQSDKPRDPNLIPTELTVDAPSGVTLAEIVWPTPTEFQVEGLPDKLLVFEHEFVIGAELALATNVATGDIKIPAHLRYQACDEKACYAPTTADVEWTLTIAATASADPANAAIFKAMPFGRGSQGPRGTQGSSGSQGSRGSQGSQGSQGSEGSRGSGANDVRLLDGFTVQGTAGGYLGTSEFLTFIKNAEAG